MDETRDYVRSEHGSDALKILDERMGRVGEVGFLSQFSLPSSLWQSGASVQANEYRAAMQVSVTRHL